MEGIDDLLIVAPDVENGERVNCSVAFLADFSKRKSIGEMMSQTDHLMHLYMQSRVRMFCC
jgi:hypothetical protein